MLSAQLLACIVLSSRMGAAPTTGPHQVSRIKPHAGYVLPWKLMRARNASKKVALATTALACRARDFPCLSSFHPRRPPSHLLLASPRRAELRRLPARPPVTESREPFPKVLGCFVSGMEKGTALCPIETPHIGCASHSLVRHLATGRKPARHVARGDQSHVHYLPCSDRRCRVPRQARVRAGGGQRVRLLPPQCLCVQC